MLDEVILDNRDAGWDVESAKTFRTFDGVLRVDARALLPNGRFRYLHIFFANVEDAAAFAQAAVDALPAGAKRLT